MGASKWIYAIFGKVIYLPPMIFISLMLRYFTRYSLANKERCYIVSLLNMGRLINKHLNDSTLPRFSRYRHVIFIFATHFSVWRLIKIGYSLYAKTKLVHLMSWCIPDTYIIHFNVNTAAHPIKFLSVVVWDFRWFIRKTFSIFTKVRMKSCTCNFDSCKIMSNIYVPNIEIVLKIYLNAWSFSHTSVVVWNIYVHASYQNQNIVKEEK